MWKYFNLGTYHPILYIPTPPGPAQILTLVRGKMRRMLSMKPLIHHIASEWITSSIKKIPILSHIDDTLSLSPCGSVTLTSNSFRLNDKNYFVYRSICGTVGRAVAAGNSDPRFESSHW